MTVAGPSGKTILRRLVTAGSVCLFALLFVLALPSRNFAGVTTERVVTDRLSGLAIAGYDPVAYFVDRTPTVGRAGWETMRDGAAWRFANPGNRAAFIEAPEIYMPQFGGYDPIAVARGVATPGHPEVWFIFRDRLFLFFSARARDAFEADPAKGLAEAEGQWDAVKALLVD